MRTRGSLRSRLNNPPRNRIAGAARRASSDPIRVPRHVGVIPDGNRRWARTRGMARQDGYAAGILPGIRLMQQCRELGVEELSIYGFTKENVHRPADQVAAFRGACVEFAERALSEGVALLVVGDASSRAFPDELRPLVERRTRGDLRVNLLVNYGWQWDLKTALTGPEGASDPRGALASRDVSRIDLVVRWGGRRRLSGFLPIQTAYADLHVIDTLWPEMRAEEFVDALRWYARQDVTLGG